MKPTPACLMAIALFLIANATNAATLILAGTIGQVDAGSYAGVSVGDSYQLRVDYEPTLVDDDPSPDLGRHLIPSQSIVLTVAGSGVVFESLGGSINTAPGSGGGPGEIWILGSEAGFHMFLMLQDDTVPTIVDDSFPDPFPQLAEFDVAGFGIITNGPTVGGPTLPELSGSVSTMTVPEPHTTLLVALGSLAAGVRHRPQKNKLGDPQRKVQ